MQIYSLTRALLEHMAENRHLLVDALIPRHPRSRLARGLLGLDHRRYPSAQSAKHTISTLLCRLRKEGLIASSGPKRKTIWTITRKGKIYLRETPFRPSSQMSDYDLPPEDAVVRLVSFDIPERHRAKRIWLRKTLLACDYEPLHKSVFIGRRPLPEEVIRDIKNFNLISYIHIVGLDKKGTVTSQKFYTRMAS